MVGVHEFLHYANEAMKEFLVRQAKEPLLRCVVAPLRETFFWCALPSGLDVPCEAFLPHATAQRRNVKSKNPNMNPLSRILSHPLTLHACYLFIDLSCIGI